MRRRAGHWNRRSRVPARRHVRVELLTVALFLLFPLGPGLTSWSPASFADSVTLGETTTVIGNGSASMLVHVPSTASISTRSLFNPDVDIEAEGRFTAVVIVSSDRPSTGPSLVAATATSLQSWCIGPPKDPMMFCPRTVLMGAPLENWDIENQVASLPEGDYRLHLVTDGGPAGVTLRFHGLVGSVQLAPSDASTAAVAWLDPAIQLPTHQPVWFGASGDVGSRGVAFSAAWFRGTTHLDHEMAWCYYRRDAPPYAYMPGCPSADYMAHFGYLWPAPSYITFGWAMDFEARGRSGLGWWFAGAALVDDAEGVDLWLSYHG